MSKSRRAAANSESMFESYVQLTRALLEGVTGICLFDPRLHCLGNAGQLAVTETGDWLRKLKWTEESRVPLAPASAAPKSGRRLTALPLQRTDGTLLGAFCVQQRLQAGTPSAAAQASSLALTLKPVLDSLHRELASRSPERSRIQTLTERAAELEWLFKVTSDLKGSPDERLVVEGLLKASTERLKSAFGVLMIPDRRLTIECERDPAQGRALRDVWTRVRPHLLTWSHRRQRPLVLNGVGRDRHEIARCKILCVPVVRDTGRVIGALAFFNPGPSPDYEARHAFLARHLGRQMGSIVEAQFDLMTGLYTRDGMQQMYGRVPETTGGERSVIYVDIDHMHVVNELHGFELGNELIVRVAGVIGPPLLPEGAIAARSAGDRFAIILPGDDARVAVGVAQRIQDAVKRLVIGPADSPVEASVSCGVAALVSMPQGLARAIAAAELACKTAKNRGRHRVELYACEDQSMARQHDDVVAVGQLRDALKSERLLLYAQRIVPLRDASLPGGYEILMRMRAADGEIKAPGPLIGAAQRYQLLPSIDRWVAQHTLQLLAPYRSMLKTRGITLSLNLSGQSIGDEDLARQLAEQLQAANLPAGTLSIEITEQAAVASLARANAMIQHLKPWGCRFALDDFGTGANSLTYLKALQISRVKIDGSFVRDIVTNPRSQATVRAIVELARGFSIDTVAEFVENEAIAEAVRDLGVDYAQGYAFGKPAPLEGILKELAADESRRLHRLFLEI
ncbi:MAG TPA: EAL domain-containing protein [Steroidobacteraceae bacterium]|nr:EAL domain-containing protein [Steroidobacteraceae bacterium]